MLAPQSAHEIAPFLAELQQMDRLLDIIWDPKARITTPGSYTATGHRTDPEYDGRWKVIRYDSAEHGHAGVHEHRGYTVVCEVTTYGRQDGILYMIAEAAYEPIDARLLELMRSADQWNVEQARKLREKLWAQHDALEAAEEKIDESQAIEGLDRVHFKTNFVGGVGNYPGKGADFEQMAKDAAARAAAQTRGAVSRILGHH